MEHRRRRLLPIGVLLLLSSTTRALVVSPAFVTPRVRSSIHSRMSTRLYSDWNDNQDQDSNIWRSSEEEDALPPGNEDEDDWQVKLQRKQDGSYWSDFEPLDDDDDDDMNNHDSSKAKLDSELSDKDSSTSSLPEDEAADAWLDTLASLTAEEVEFNLKEADRADKVRQMEEWGFDATTIGNALDVAINDTLDTEELQSFRESAYEEDDDDVDYATVESHTRVDKDDETGEPIRSQMVYVDEHTCIGCTNCAMIAPSTFFMHDEHGRARVFSQWGDDDTTIQIAIETCPVDCIHYVPYDELVNLEVERRDQNINFKARLVSQGEYGGVGGSHMVGGANGFTAPQTISGNLGTRCNNCPSRGCGDCPMYGVGKNPEFVKKEQARKARIAKKRMQAERERQNKSADL